MQAWLHPTKHHVAKVTTRRSPSSTTKTITVRPDDPDLRLCFSFMVGGVPRSARGCLVTSLLSSLEYERILFVNYDRDEKVIQCFAYTLFGGFWAKP